MGHQTWWDSFTLPEFCCLCLYLSLYDFLFVSDMPVQKIQPEDTAEEVITHLTNNIIQKVFYKMVNTIELK